MISIDKIYVLNLQRRLDRRLHIQNEFTKSNRLNNSYEIFTAVDGNLIDSNGSHDIITIDALSRINNPSDHEYGLHFNTGSLAILYSYMNLCSEAETNQHTYLIFEDDITISDTFDSDLQLIQNELPEDFDLCYLGYCVGSDCKFEPYTDNLVIPKGQLNCLYGFLLSPIGAKKIMQMKPFEYQIDTQLYLNFNNMKVFCANNKLVNCNQEFSSDGQI